MIGRTDQAYDLAVACFHSLEPFQAKEAAEKPGRAGQQDAARGFRRRIERNRFERFSVQKRGDIEVPGMKPGSVLAVDLFIFDHAFLVCQAPFNGLRPCPDITGGTDDQVHGNRDSEYRSEEHTSELQSLMRISYAVFCLKKKNTHNNTTVNTQI